MKIAAHTPGPWTLEAGRAITTESGTFCLTYGSDPRTGTPNFKSPTELDANARLIAAAPDLLNMLQRLLDEVTSAETLPGTVALLTIEHARAAILKARGETEA